MRHVLQRGDPFSHPSGSMSFLTFSLRAFGVFALKSPPNFPAILCDSSPPRTGFSPRMRCSFTPQTPLEPCLKPLQTPPNPFITCQSPPFFRIRLQPSAFSLRLRFLCLLLPRDLSPFRKSKIKNKNVAPYVAPCSTLCSTLNLTSASAGQAV